MCHTLAVQHQSITDQRYRFQILRHGGDGYVGVNYGWPMREGPCSIGKSTNCAITDDSLVQPYHFYQHTQLEEGGCFVGSVWVPDNIGWPEKYKFLFIDFIYNTTYNLIEVPGNECRECTPPRPGYINETFYEREIMVDMFFGPYNDTQALYVISRGSGQSTRRIRYTGSANVAPVANITISDDAADVNVAIEFDGSPSSDGDNDSITFLWDFGDGGTSTDALTEHAYETYGRYTATLTVTDVLGQTNQAYEIINIGIPPVANMISPVLGDRFSVGQKLLVLGNATDAVGVELNDTQISWEVRQHHAKHYHPFLDRESGVGNGFTLDPAPDPEDYMAANNSYLEIIMYATDSFGLFTAVSRNIYPKKVFIVIDSTPQGLEVLVDEFPVITPTIITSWENHRLHLNVLDQDNMVFSSWSMGGDRKTNYTVPARQLTNPTVMVTLTSSVLDVVPVTAPVTAPVQEMPSSHDVTAPVEVVESPKTTDAPIVAPAPDSTNSINLGSRSHAVTSRQPLLSSCWFFVTMAVLSCYFYKD
jgi:PKD repeat protein